MNFRLFRHTAPFVLLMGMYYVAYRAGYREGRHALAGAAGVPAEVSPSSPSIAEGKATELSPVRRSPSATVPTTGKFASDMAHLRTLVEAITDRNQRNFLLEMLTRVDAEPLGPEFAMAAILHDIPGAGAERAAWRERFSTHPNRAAILSALLHADDLADPSGALEATADWTDWERCHFGDAILSEVPGDPRLIALIAENAGLFSSDGIDKTFLRVAQETPEALEPALADTADPEARSRALRARATVLSGDTASALAWADALPSEADREIAHDAIYEATPRGIGAILRTQEGLPIVEQVLPGSPLENAGVVSGDRIVAVENPDGTLRDFYGRKVENVVDNLRGEPGSTTTLRILRWDESNRRMTEQSVTVTREQLILGPKVVEKR